MGLFNFFQKNQPQTTTIPTKNGVVENNNALEIPKNIFVENREPQDQPTFLSSQVNANGIETIYSFLQADYDTKGYSDALTNPDDSTKSNGVKLIKMDLKILVQRVNNFHAKRIRDFDLHISSRGRSGLIDLVEELKSEKEKTMKDIEEVKVIESEIETGGGMVERTILSYQKGFMRGLSAITQSKILN